MLWNSMAATCIYRCPTTGFNVQGWFADDVSANEGERLLAFPAAAAIVRLAYGLLGWFVRRHLRRWADGVN
jgi:hypothetical protein